MVYTKILTFIKMYTGLLKLKFAFFPDNWSVLPVTRDRT